MSNPQSGSEPGAGSERSGGPGFLGLIERLGNRLPDPIFLFMGALVLVITLSSIGAAMRWSVQPLRPQAVTESVTDGAGRRVQRAKVAPDGRPVLELVSVGDPVTPRSLASAAGLYWLVANMIRNFINFPPLGVVVVSMFGIGVAEKVGLFGAAMKWLAGLMPSRLLTPTVIMLGFLSHMASDAGFIILPPLAAGLFLAYRRPPLAGIAAAYAGIGGGFSANLLVGPTDALVGGITETGARILDPGYTVLPTCNWYFMACSSILLMLCGWGITAWLIEPRLAAQPLSDHAADARAQRGDLSPLERRGLIAAGIALLLVVGVLAVILLVPGAPLHGPMPVPAPAYGPIPDVASAAGIPPASSPTPQPRWSVAIVPIIVTVFLFPGLAYGLVTGSLRTQADVSRAFVHAMSSMAPVLAMSFFAAQFIESFRYSRLDIMLAYTGGEALASSGLPPMALLPGIVVLTMVINMLIASMSAKWTVLAPIIVPMMMMVGLSPELTQSAYRVGDSVTNIVTPLNPYSIVILAAIQRYRRDCGMGRMLAMMTPYTLVFTGVWIVFLLLYVWLAVPLGPGTPMWYQPGR